MQSTKQMTSPSLTSLLARKDRGFACTQLKTMGCFIMGSSIWDWPGQLGINWKKQKSRPKHKCNTSTWTLLPDCKWHTPCCASPHTSLKSGPLWVTKYQTSMHHDENATCLQLSSAIPGVLPQQQHCPYCSTWQFTFRNMVNQMESFWVFEAKQEFIPKT